MTRARDRERRWQRGFLLFMSFLTAWYVHAHDAGIYGKPMTGAGADNSDPICLLVFIVLACASFRLTRATHER